MNRIFNNKTNLVAIIVVSNVSSVFSDGFIFLQNSIFFPKFGNSKIPRLPNQHKPPCKHIFFNMSQHGGIMRTGWWWITWNYHMTVPRFWMLSKWLQYIAITKRTSIVWQTSYDEATVDYLCSVIHNLMVRWWNSVFFFWLDPDHSRRNCCLHPPCLLNVHKSTNHCWLLY